MREIKFRFWSKALKLMTPVFSLGEIWEGVSQEWSPLYHEDLIPLEYISRKDMNGKEIFEGDVVQHVSTGGFLFEVFLRQDGRWHLRRGDEVFNNGDYYDGDEVYWENFSVIGNIYENPELMEASR